MSDIREAACVGESQSSDNSGGDGVLVKVGDQGGRIDECRSSAVEVGGGGLYAARLDLSGGGGGGVLSPRLVPL